MTIPHPCAAILIAIAEGKTVQWKAKIPDSKEWNDYKLEDSACITPLKTPNLEWRIKPTLKTGWVVIWINGNGDLRATVYNVKQNTGSNSYMIAQVQFTEGEGLDS